MISNGKSHAPVSLCQKATVKSVSGASGGILTFATQMVGFLWPTCGCQPLHEPVWPEFFASDSCLRPDTDKSTRNVTVVCIGDDSAKRLIRGPFQGSGFRVKRRHAHPGQLWSLFSKKMHESMQLQWSQHVWAFLISGIVAPAPPTIGSAGSFKIHTKSSHGWSEVTFLPIYVYIPNTCWWSFMYCMGVAKSPIIHHSHCDTFQYSVHVIRSTPPRICFLRDSQGQLWHTPWRLGVLKMFPPGIQGSSLFANFRNREHTEFEIAPRHKPGSNPSNTVCSLTYPEVPDYSILTYLDIILESCFLSHLTGGCSFWDLFRTGGYLEGWIFWQHFLMMIWTFFVHHKACRCATILKWFWLHAGAMNFWRLRTVGLERVHNPVRPHQWEMEWWTASRNGFWTWVGGSKGSNNDLFVRVDPNRDSFSLITHCTVSPTLPLLIKMNLFQVLADPFQMGENTISSKHLSGFVLLQLDKYKGRAPNPSTPHGLPPLVSSPPPHTQTLTAAWESPTNKTPTKKTTTKVAHWIITTISPTEPMPRRHPTWKLQFQVSARKATKRS